MTDNIIDLLFKNEVVAYETATTKVISHPDYHMIFDKTRGNMARWGRHHNEDAVYAPLGPELLDLEIVVDGCNGAGHGPCTFCYKANTNQTPRYMTYNTFRTLLSKFPKVNNVYTLTQIAFGITGVQSNPDFIKIMRHARRNGIIPNFTMTGADLTDELVTEISKLCGAVAISCYETDPELCFNTIKRMTDAGMQQVNMHLLYHANNLPFVYRVLETIQTDSRLEKLNAVVLLAGKPKGRGKKLQQPTQEDFTKLITYVFANNIRVGFDSCSATRFTKALNSIDLSDTYRNKLLTLIEPCESFGMFSSYVNVDGVYTPCSFGENEHGWETGIDLLRPGFDFMYDLWENPKTIAWRVKSIANDRQCLFFDLT